MEGEENESVEFIHLTFAGTPSYLGLQVLSAGSFHLARLPGYRHLLPPSPLQAWKWLPIVASLCTALLCVPKLYPYLCKYFSIKLSLIIMHGKQHVFPATTLLYSRQEPPVLERYCCLSTALTRSSCGVFLSHKAGCFWGLGSVLALHFCQFVMQALSGARSAFVSKSPCY